MVGLEIRWHLAPPRGGRIIGDRAYRDWIVNKVVVNVKYPITRCIQVPLNVAVDTHVREDLWKGDHYEGG